MAGASWLAGFSPQGEVVYASENVIGPSLRRVLRAVDVAGRATRQLPLADAREAAFDPEGKALWFTRYGLQVSGDNAQDYRGGAISTILALERQRGRGSAAHRARPGRQPFDADVVERAPLRGE